MKRRRRSTRTRSVRRKQLRALQLKASRARRARDDGDRRAVAPRTPLRRRSSRLSERPPARARGTRRAVAGVASGRRYFLFVVPVPDSGTASGESVALLVIVSAPPRAPSAVGRNLIVTLHFLRGAIVGPHPLTSEKSPLATIPTKVTAASLLAFVITRRFGLLVAPAPNTTLPSLRPRGDTPSAATGFGGGGAVRVGLSVP